MSTPAKHRLPRGRGFLLAPIALILFYYGAYFVLRGPLPATPNFIKLLEINPSSLCSCSKVSIYLKAIPQQIIFVYRKF